MNFPGVIVDLPTLTEKVIDGIANFGCANDVEFIAASFVRKASDITQIREVLTDNGCPHIKIICKIENLEGLEIMMPFSMKLLRKVGDGQSPEG